MSTHSELAHDVTELSFWPAWTTILAERQDALKADIASARRTLGHGCVLSPLAEGPGSDAGEVGDVVGEHAGPAGAKSSLSGCAAADGRSVRTPPRFPVSEADVRMAVRSRTRRLTKVQRRQNVYRRAARVSMPSIKTSTAKSNRSSPSPATMYAAWAAR